MRSMSLITAVLVAAALLYWFGLRHPSAGMAADGTQVVEATSAAVAKDEDAPVPVMVLQSRAQETSAPLILRGRTQALRDVEVSAETTGRVISEPLRHGAVVKAGQVLCRLDPAVRSAELAEAEAALAEAEAEASAATQLEAKGFTAETALRARQAQLRAAQAHLDKIRWDIERLEITAPFDGLLESDAAELGSLLIPGSVCANVVDLSEIKVEAYVSEQAVDQMSLDQPAEARLINGMTATGKITFISRMADAETRTYQVEVTLPNPDRSIRSGMTTELTIELPPQKAHLVPQSALTLDDDGRLGVRTAADGSARFNPVAILRDVPDGVWISGLPAQADIIVVGQEFVRDGRKIAATPVSLDQLE